MARSSTGIRRVLARAGTGKTELARGSGSRGVDQLGPAVVFGRRSFGTANELTHAYMKCLNDEVLLKDENQQMVIDNLATILERVEQYAAECATYEKLLAKEESDASDNTKGNTETRDDGDKKPRNSAPRLPQGLYIWGSVGTGKSVCMDLFFASCPIEKKRRVHFHDFMSEIHERVHAWKCRRNIEEKERGEKISLEEKGQDNRISAVGKIDLSPESDALLNVALDISNEAKLLCFDEFQVTDIADAVIMTKLFNTMWKNGTVIVSTSNRAPLDLYENGLNRRDFLPFIGSLQRYCKVLNMSEEKDYRMLAEQDRDANLFLSPINASNRADYEDKFQLYCGLETVAIERSVSIPTKFGRTIEVPQLCGGVCRFEFGDLCRRDIGAGDFAALAENFHTIFIDGIPVMSTELHNEARRFITLVDQLYESKLRVVCLADVGPQELFGAHPKLGAVGVVEEAGDETYDWDGPKVKGMHKLINKVNESELSSVKELRFAFQRAASRLVEMNSVEYLRNVHVPK